MNRREFLTALAATAVNREPPGWTAGVATADITPKRLLWMAGFARRTLPAQGTAMALHAKALALRCADQPAVVLVTVDLLGLTARTTNSVAAIVRRRHRIPRENILFNASHTHCGPVVDEQLSVAYDLPATEWRAIRDYTRQLEGKLSDVIATALNRLQPARLAYGRDQAGFATNRRVKFGPRPVDRSVPVLRVDDARGAPLAIVFGYACHNTTLQDGFVQYHGDYAGVAQSTLEKRHRGAPALFVAGCGADANPMPRGTLELVNAHGTALADAVDRALTSVTSIEPAIRTAYTTVGLPFANDAVRERWRRQLDIEDVYLRRHAALMQQVVARDGRLPATQADPVQVWQFGATDAADAGVRERGAPALTLVALGGEVVVDYALRLAREYPQRQMWVAGYSNDVFGYVPSERVLREGGYEGGDAMIYYGRPGPFAEGVEERITSEVRRLIQTTR
jgi:hypothetical protein